MSASVSRRDNTDRSLARSAWESVPRKNRPVGYGMPGIANPRGISPRNVRGRVTRRWTWSETPPMNLGIIPFCLAMPPMSGQRRSRILEFRTQTRSFVLKTLNVQGTRKCLPWNRCAHLHESHRTLRDGSFGVALSQALRARLRSHRALRDCSFGWRCPRHFVPGYDRTVPSGTALLGWRCPRHFVPGYDRTVPSETLRNRPLVRRPDFRNESRRCGENSLEMVNCWDPSGSAGGHRDWCDRNHCGLGRRGYRSGRGRNWGDRTVHPIGIFRSS